VPRFDGEREGGRGDVASPPCVFVDAAEAEVEGESEREPLPALRGTGRGGSAAATE
jgi:hypothetical protein